MEERKLNVSIVDGNSFYAHEVSVNYNPNQFVLDFKSISPRIDIRTRKTGATNIVIEHNVVLTDPYHAKKIHQLLGGVIQAYEKEYGEIKKSKALTKYEQKKNKEMKDTKPKKKDAGKKVDKEPTVSSPSYFG